MRSYETARSLFDFLEFVAWATVVIGALMAIGIPMSLGQYARTEAVLLAAIPGVGLALSGLLSVAFVQNSRANVDSAEYGQQMLQIARDQLEISRRSLKLQHGEPAKTFGDAVKKHSENLEPERTFSGTDGSQNSSYAGAKRAKKLVADGGDRIGYDNPPGSVLEGNDFGYRGRFVRRTATAFLYDCQSFDTAEAAKIYIDRLSGNSREIDLDTAVEVGSLALSSRETKDELQEPLTKTTEQEPPLPDLEIEPEPDPEIEPEQADAPEPALEGEVEPERVSATPSGSNIEPSVEETEEESIDYMGQYIDLVGGRYCVGSRRFRTLEMAQNFIDQKAKNAG